MPNQLLRAVLSDIQVPQYLAGCKALGLINKMVTGPLWCVLESRDVSILDMNDRYQKLKSCFEEWSRDATCVLSGTCLLKTRRIMISCPLKTRPIMISCPLKTRHIMISCPLKTRRIMISCPLKTRRIMISCPLKTPFSAY